MYIFIRLININLSVYYINEYKSTYYIKKYKYLCILMCIYIIFININQSVCFYIILMNIKFNILYIRLY